MTSPAEQRHPLVFFHVMKCGGTSIRAALTGAVPDPAGSVFELDGAAAMAATGGLLAQTENWRFRGELLSYLLTADRPRVVLGHFRYLDDHARFLDGASFVTMLRPPVERVISLYRYRRYGRRQGLAAARPLSELLDEPGWHAAGHHYVDTFCGSPDHDPSSAEAIDAAVANLRRFSVVGRLDDTATFAQDATRELGREVAIGITNSSPAPDRPDDDADSDGLRERLAELCAPDQQIYDRIIGV